MPTHLLPKSNYLARAVLLKYMYDMHDHTLVTFSEAGMLLCFDPDTMEEIHSLEGRIKKYAGYDYPPEPEDSDAGA